jgi:hypothetical protein
VPLRFGAASAILSSMAQSRACRGTYPAPRPRAARLCFAIALATAALLPLAPASGDVVVPNPTVLPADTRTNKSPPPPPATGATATAPIPDKPLNAAPANPLVPPQDPEQIEKDLRDIKSKAVRIARAKNQRTALRTRVEEILKGRPMDHELKQELVRHARRLARLERIRTIAKDQKDDPGGDRAAKLLEKENARHDKWMGEFDARTAKGAP